MRPLHLTRLVIDRFQHAFAPHAIISACPAERAVRGLREVDPIARMRADNKQPGLRIEARRPVIRQPALVRRNQPAVRSRIFRRIRNRLSLLIEARRPVHRTERSRHQALAGLPVQHEEVPVARCLHQHLPRLAVEVAIHQHRNLHRVPVVRVVRRRLKRPLLLPRVRIDRHDAARIRVVARPHVAIQHRRRISRAPEHRVRIGIVSAGHPRHAAGRRIGRARRRRAVPAPLRLARLRVDRLQEPRQIIEVARNTDQHMIPDNQRRHRRPVAARRNPPPRRSSAPCRPSRSGRSDANPAT